MEMHRLTREADELIRKVVARYNSLYSPSGKISHIELDLLLEELRQLYDRFKLMGQLNLQVPEKEHPATAATQPPAETLADRQEAVQPQQEEKAEEVRPEPEPEPVHQRREYREEPAPAQAEQLPMKEESPVPSVPEQTPQWTVPATHKPSPEEPPQTLADRYKTDHKSLSESMAGSTVDNSLGSRLQHQPIEDLKSVIGLAEKFNFINQLFGGDPLAYDKAISQLNSATRLPEAEAYLGTLGLNFKWAADSAEAAKLAEIIRRKFHIANRP